MKVNLSSISSDTQSSEEFYDSQMINLPEYFPMYCRDLKQMIDGRYEMQSEKEIGMTRLESWLKTVKRQPDYPKEENEHNALADARWNKKLYEFITHLDVKGLHEDQLSQTIEVT